MSDDNIKVPRGTVVVTIKITFLIIQTLNMIYQDNMKLSNIP